MFCPPPPDWRGPTVILVNALGDKLNETTAYVSEIHRLSPTHLWQCSKLTALLKLMSFVEILTSISWCILMAQDQLLHLIERMNIDPALPANNKRVKKNMRTLLNQSSAKPKPTATWSQAFSRVGRQLPWIGLEFSLVHRFRFSLLWLAKIVVALILV